MNRARPSASPKALPGLRRPRRRKWLTVLGAGGNIGSHLVPLVARLPGVGRLTLVDPDRYEERNLRAQAISARDIGQWKARVQARLVRRINPALEVEAIVGRLEDVPLGRLRADVILGCLDSKESRRGANEAAWRLGVPWIDAGVEPSLMLARVDVYLPAEGQPCLECAWDEHDYAELAVHHPCDPAGLRTPASNSPACLGALAGALQAVECHKLIGGDSAAALVGRQVVIEARTLGQFVTAFRRNPACRFDHATWKISPLGGRLEDLSVGALLELAGGPRQAAALSFGGRALVKRLDCPGCGFARRVFQLQHRLEPRDRRCGRCGREMLSAGFHMKTRLTRADLGPGDADRSLASLGLLGGDVVSLSNGTGQKYYQLRRTP
jgi:adenylyltransferase/sulfurtransferase